MATSKSGKRKAGTSSGAPRSYSEMYKSSAAGVAPAPAPAPPKTNTPKTNAPAAAAPVAAVQGSDSVDWTGEYGYVLKDLRYLAIVTVICLAFILVMSFVL